MDCRSVAAIRRSGNRTTASLLAVGGTEGAAYPEGFDEQIRDQSQDVAVRVVRVGIPSPGQQQGNQAQTLIREADERIMLPPEFWQEHFRLRPDLITVSLLDGYMTDQSPEEVAHEIGRLVAEEWVHRVPRDEVYSLADMTRLPKELDTDLLVAADLLMSIPRGGQGVA